MNRSGFQFQAWFPFWLLSVHVNYFWIAAPPAIDQWKNTYISDPMQTYKKIHDLKSDTQYTLSIWAVTQMGNGEKNTIEEKTVAEQGGNNFYYRVEVLLTSGCQHLLLLGSSQSFPCCTDAWRCVILGSQTLKDDDDEWNFQMFMNKKLNSDFFLFSSSRPT